jgi:hypothetical protein
VHVHPPLLADNDLPKRKKNNRELQTIEKIVSEEICTKNSVYYSVRINCFIYRAARAAPKIDSVSYSVRPNCFIYRAAPKIDSESYSVRPNWFIYRAAGAAPNIDSESFIAIINMLFTR